MATSMRKTASIVGLMMILAATAIPTVIIPSQLASAQILDPTNPIVPFLPEEQIQAPTAGNIQALQQAALQEKRTTVGPAVYQSIEGFDEMISIRVLGLWYLKVGL